MSTEQTLLNLSNLAKSREPWQVSQSALCVIMIYTHVASKSPLGVRSPLDRS